MNNFDTPNNREQLLKQHIENVKLALRKIKPELKSLISSNTEARSHQVELKNRGLFDIKIDQQAINSVLLACGVSEEALNKIKVEFRSAKLADRNFWGQPMAGLRMDLENDSQLIEVYTSLPQTVLSQDKDTNVSLEKTKIINFAFKKEQITATLLEELRHAIQVELNLFDTKDGSFESSDYGDLRKIDYEQDADLFTNDLVKYLLPFIEISKYEIPGLEEMYINGKEVKEDFPEAVGSYLDKNLVAQVRETDPPGLYLSQEVTVIDVLDEVKVNNLLERIEKSLNKREIGFFEARWLYKQLHQKLKSVGDTINSQNVLEKIEEIS